MSHSLFLGSNTSQGFYGFFSQFLERASHAFLLKGGPGVGKNTFMRETASFLEKQGQTIEYFSCSGDPDSLDAIFSRETGFLMADATAPHTLDPIYPGVRDEIINLGVCLDSEQLFSQKDNIQSLQKEIKENYVCAYRYLSAAEKMAEEAQAVCLQSVSENKIAALQKELFSFLPSAGQGKSQHYFAQAITCQGTLSHLDAVSFEKSVCLDLPWGMNSNLFLSPLFKKAQAEQVKCTVFHDPLSPEKISHLKIGNTLFTGASFNKGISRSITLPSPVSSRLSFSKAAFRLLMNQSYEALSQANQKHDILERIYTDAMNYDHLKDIKNTFFSKL